jgi:type II secretory pathway component GspD/PulD (secretin)
MLHQSAKSALTLIVLISGILGCTSLQEQGKADHDNARDVLRDKLMKDSVVTVHKKSFGGVKRLSESEQIKAANAWLRAIRVTLDIKEPVSATEIVRMLKKQGINMTAATDLAEHTYSGFGVKDVDGETALNVLFGAMGLDYSVNSEGKYVTITPLGSKTFYLNLGNRQTYFGGGTEGSNSQGGQTGFGMSGQTSSSASASTSSGAGQMGYGGSQGGQTGSGVSGQTSSSTSTSSSNSQGNTIVASDQFWRSLSSEIEQRLKVLTPNKMAMNAAFSVPPVIPNPSEMPSELTGITLPKPSTSPDVIPSSNGNGNYYIEQKMGNFSTNPETGAVTIRAPRWLLDSFTDYFQRISDQYNTVVEFEGEIVHLTTDGETLEGLDVAAFASFAHGQYGAAITKNDLGGVNVTLPSATDTLAAVAGNAFPAAVPMVGIVSAANKLQIFNAYLSNIGHIDIVQKPVLVTSSGIPGEFKKTERRFYNNVQQTAAAGGVGSATTATQNTLVPIDTGISLRIYPHYDSSHGLIRAQISLQQAIQTGVQNQTQYLTVGNTTQQVATEIPIISQQQYSGETLLRDGDLIIVGGQVEDANNIGHSGITGMMDIDYMHGIFGRKNTKNHYSTYYFALHAKVKKRNT